MNNEQHLSRRERQIMDVLHAKKTATAAEIREALPDAPGYSAVRALLRILEDKGHIKHREESGRYVYEPCVSQKTASHSALKRILSTFFGGSLDEAVAALLEASDKKLPDAELKKLQEIIKQAERKENENPD
jgi:BlaI family transcriptional regulator, penicillinase repressor